MRASVEYKVYKKHPFMTLISMVLGVSITFGLIMLIYGLFSKSFGVIGIGLLVALLAGTLKVVLEANEVRMASLFNKIGKRVFGSCDEDLYPEDVVLYNERISEILKDYISPITNEKVSTVQEYLDIVESIKQNRICVTDGVYSLVGLNNRCKELFDNISTIPELIEILGDTADKSIERLQEEGIGLLVSSEENINSLSVEGLLRDKHCAASIETEPELKIAYCSSCGAAAIEGAGYCNICGKRLIDEIEEIVVGQQLSDTDMDQIRKWKQLLDERIISSEEFENKKKEILGI